MTRGASRSRGGSTVETEGTYILPTLMGSRESGPSGDGINSSTGTRVDADTFIFGTSGDDVLLGTAADEVFVGYDGNDTLTGGAGDDTFYFENLGEGTDVITDFGVGADQIRVYQPNFSTDLELGVLAIENFALGSSATTADHRFIYDQATGALYFDADGVGGADQVQIATLSNNVSLSNTDIMVGL